MEDLQDWEVLNTSDSSFIDPSLTEDGNSRNSLIKSDHFILDSSSPSVDFPIDSFPEVAIPHIPEEINDFRGIQEEGCECEDDVKNDVGFQGISEIHETDQVQSSEDGSGEVESSESSGGNGVEGKRCIVWWKLPFEVWKLFAFRVSPVWTFSIAAAVVGLVILKRRLSRMRRKTSRSIPVNLTVEDKKVSQFMMRAARLNQAFSVVRRVPIIRPQLPAAGTTQWPVQNMR